MEWNPGKAENLPETTRQTLVKLYQSDGMIEYKKVLAVDYADSILIAAGLRFFSKPQPPNSGTVFPLV